MLKTILELIRGAKVTAAKTALDKATIAMAISRIRELEAEIVLLQNLRDYDRRGRTDGVENPRPCVFPDHPIYPTYPDLPPMDDSCCAKCGIAFQNMNNYACPRQDCPGRFTFSCNETEGVPYQYANTYEYGSMGPGDTEE